MQDRLSILSSGICKYTWYGKKTTEVKVSKKSLANLSKIVIAKSLSKSSAKKIRLIISNWVLAIKMTQRKERGKVKFFSNYLIMITLTLPAKQYESDKVIKSKYLNLFLQKLRYHSDNLNYLWVCEKQKNGNIHFHLITDRYFKKELIQTLWNESLATGEYINMFQKKFGYRNPPSTKITSQNQMKDTAEYITKYVTKAEESRPMDGKLWDCSDSLIGLYKLFFSWKPVFYDIIAVDFARFDMKYIVSDFRELFLFSKRFIDKFLSTDLFYELEFYLNDYFSHVFPILANPILIKKNQPSPLSFTQLQFAF